MGTFENNTRNITILTSALVIFLSVFMLQYNYAAAAQGAVNTQAAKSLFYNSIVAALVSELGTIVLSWHSDTNPASMIQLVAVSPLLVLDLAIIEVWAGLVLSYDGDNESRRRVIIQSSFLGCYLVAIIFWLWKDMSLKNKVKPRSKENKASGENQTFIKLLN